MENKDWRGLEGCWFDIVVYKMISFCQKLCPLQTLIAKAGEVDKKPCRGNHERMSDSNTLKTPSFAPIGYTALAVLLSLVARSLFMPKWTPVQEPVRELTFLILWIMALLPVLYLAFRRWAEESIESFFPQVFVFLALSFAIQTALNAVSMGFDLLQIPNSAVMPFVWALPWLALTTKFKMSYATRAQCKSLLLTILPIALVFHILYLMLPIFALAYIGVAAATATLFGLTALCYGLVAWRLRMSLLKRPLTRA